MKRFTIKDRYHKLEVSAEGKAFTYRLDDEPFYVECTLRSEGSYDEFIRRINSIRRKYIDDPITGWRMIDELLGSDNIYEFVTNDKYYRQPDEKGNVVKLFTIKDDIDSLTCESDGKTLTYRWGDEPMYVEYTLRSDDSFDKFKNWVSNLYGRYSDPRMAWAVINDSLQSDHMDEFVTGEWFMHCDPRSEDEIEEYLEEACDKVWLMRNCYISTREPIHEASRPAMERILRTYSDIPKDGYTDWECGYWNGILGALRWVLQSEKDDLDT